MTDLSIFDSYDDDPPAAVAVIEGEFELLPDGVYLDLEPETYFLQGLGSTDLVTLMQRGYGWWWKSRHNPLKRSTSTAAMTYGSALHAIMLEGVSVYEARFLIEPDKADYPGLLVSTDDIKAALAKAGVGLQGTSKFKKPDWVQAALSELPDAMVWDHIWAAFERTRGEPPRPYVTSVEDRMLRLMRDMAADTSTPEAAQVAKLLNDPDHPALAEVSVLYTDKRGIRRRARFDRLFPAFDLDLKSLRGHWQGRSLEVSLDDVIKKGGYDIQRADYHEARKYLYAFIRLGMENVHGGTPEQRAWLATWPDRYPHWDWVWLFYQKPDMEAGDAPVLFPLWDDGPTLRRDTGRLEMSPYHLRGYRKKERALDFYQGAVAAFGLTTPWARVSELHYTDQDRLPRILTYDDSHPWGQAPVDGEDAYTDPI